MSGKLRERLLWASLIVIAVHLSWSAFRAAPQDALPLIGGAINLIDIPAVIYLWVHIAWPWPRNEGK